MNQRFLFGSTFGPEYLNTDEFKFVGNNESCEKARSYLKNCIEQSEPATIPGPGCRTDWTGLKTDCPNCIIIAREKALGQILGISFLHGTGGAVITAEYGKIYAR